MSIIQVKNITKVYKLYKDPKDRLKEALHPMRKKYHEDFYALRDISFEIKKGETVGIIGKNGSGKSTLLKILTGVLTPSSGNCKISGKIASLLELGAGFNPELSGLENVYFNGSVLGYSREEMEQKLSEILDFADIGEFIYQPVKTYSSGMFVRLAFSVAINVEPEVLIVDEALSVGDMRFQLKCFRKLEEIKSRGTTILLVTHDTGTVQNQCDRAIWINEGNLKEVGEPESVCKHYMSFMAYGEETKIAGGNSVEKNPPQSPFNKEEEVEEKNIPWQSLKGCESFGEGGAEIMAVAFYRKDSGEKITVLEGGEEVCLSVKISGKKDLEQPIVGFYFSDQKGNNIFGTNTFLKTFNLVKVTKNTERIIRFSFEAPLLLNDQYSLTIAIANGTQSNHIQHHWVHDVLNIQYQSSEIEARHGSRLRLRSVLID